VAAISGLAFLAFRAWLHEHRKQLPPWRNALSLASMSGVVISLLAILISFLLAVLRVDIRISASDWMAGVSLLILLATCSGLALRGLARIEIIFAGLLTATLIFANVRI
jgi:hypothetical protein